jgi:alkylation response protein AidB-like acyl-CoA dehydrogenase
MKTPGHHRAPDHHHRRRARGQRGLLRQRRGAGANLVGEENKGWTYAKYLLGHERTGIAGVGRSKRGCEAPARTGRPKETSAAGR